MRDLTPLQIVAELGRYIIGQDEAKRAVAIALRNRWRRTQVDEKLRGEIVPNNIIMIGPTGVGKTEIARRLAELSGAPFVKVEASKFTEVGYVGRDVESIVRDLIEQSVHMVRQEREAQVEKQALRRVEKRLLELLAESGAERKVLRQPLRKGELDEQLVELDVRERPPIVEVFGPVAATEEVSRSLQDALSGLTSQDGRKRKLPVREARRQLLQEEVEQLVDMSAVIADAVVRAEQMGIVFVDEIDKIASPEGRAGAEVSREGVQRDLLPIVEGAAVLTRYGTVRTDHVLFIAAGAFHSVRPSELVPELQGRFPIRVELNALGEEELARILTEPHGALVHQYAALLDVEGITLRFAPEAIREIAHIAHLANISSENIGARRLRAVMSALLDEVLFDAPHVKKKRLHISRRYVCDKLRDILEAEDLGRYVL